MFAAKPELTAKEMVRVTKKGCRIGFATWPPELAIGAIFRTNAKHLPKNPNAPPSSLLWGIPDMIKERLIGISNIYFERGTVTFPIPSPNHFWEHVSKKYGPLIKSIKVLESLGNPDEPESLRKDFLKSIDPYFVDGGLRLGYLLTIARK